MASLFLASADSVSLFSFAPRRSRAPPGSRQPSLATALFLESLPRASSRRRGSTTSSPPPGASAGKRWRYVSAAGYMAKPPMRPNPPIRERDGWTRLRPGCEIERWRDDRLAANGPTGSGTGPGEDFWFEEPVGEEGREGLAFGVADGVGGWAESGVNASIFSQSLMYHCSSTVLNSRPGAPALHSRGASDRSDSSSSSLASSHGSGSGSSSSGSSSSAPSSLGLEDHERLLPNPALDPGHILTEAHSALLADEEIKAGSSTACILTLSGKDGTLRAANLGDSSFVVAREGKVVHYQPFQTHAFNTPRQLSKLPLWESNRRGAGRHFVDDPASADAFRMQLREGDLVLAFTDGLADNVFVHEMEGLLRAVAREEGKMTEVEMVRRVANTFVSYALLASRQRKRISPFEVDARRHGVHYPGGKIDDILVVACKAKLVDDWT